MYKLKGAATPHTSGDGTDNIGSADALYILAEADTTITVAASAGTSPYAGSIKLKANQTITLAKQAADTIATTGNISCTKIAFHW